MGARFLIGSAKVTCAPTFIASLCRMSPSPIFRVRCKFSTRSESLLEESVVRTEMCYLGWQQSLMQLASHGGACRQRAYHIAQSIEAAQSRSLEALRRL